MSPALKHVLQNDSRVAYHQDTDLYEFRPLHNIRNASSLVAALATQSTGAGLPVKDLKDGYPNIEEDLGALETQGHVLVIHWKRMGHCG
jgi:transcription initiation factor TFIIE subunit beta